MRILFIGTVDFSFRCLKKLLDMDTNIVGVCTKKASSYNSDFKDLTPLCKNNSIPFLQVSKINETSSISWIKTLKPDVIFCFGWSEIICKEILSIPKIGVVGFHPTELPKNKGRHPMIWPIILGHEESASTFFLMNEYVDDGDILSQVNFPILYEDNAKSLYDKVSRLALDQIEVFVPRLQNNTYTLEKQNNLYSNYLRKRTVNDGKIDFRMTSLGIYNLVRALSEPYIGAHIEVKGRKVLVWRVKEIENNAKNIEPGKILSIKNNKIVVKCFDNAIEIIEHEFKKLPKIGDYL